ncbi:MAG: aminomethyl-transferring glycine dehydrogenase [Ignavibacteria bacterium]|nr:aminomethyl-transferring glycine dehydrogenase [Ignavibacteria bacterium]
MSADFSRTDHFSNRHIGPDQAEIDLMLSSVGSDSIDSFIESVIPKALRTTKPLGIGVPRSEHDTLASIRGIASRNEVFRSLLGMGYHDTITPPVIQRNILENPGWYTQYTPYQSEIAQGRLEALLNFQTMVIDLTGLPCANASLLDEATAAAEAMHMFHAVFREPERNTFFVSSSCHPQNIGVVKTRAKPLGITVVVGDHRNYEFGPGVFGALLQYPATDGEVENYADFCTRAHEAGALVAVAADLLSLSLLKPPGEFGADAAVGNTQRFGVPMGYGGPHAAFFSTRDEFKRHMPGRIIGVSVDRTGAPALRMALQTREQHIKREKATSNICTAQVLLAVMAGMYAVYHGPDGISGIAGMIHRLTRLLDAGLTKLGHRCHHRDFFDTIRVTPNGMTPEAVFSSAATEKINLRRFGDDTIGIALDEVSDLHEVETLFRLFTPDGQPPLTIRDVDPDRINGYTGGMRRTTPFLAHPVFNKHRSETEMLRYMKRLESRDLSLTTSMISLGSCTMKLNATTEMIPVTWRKFGSLHPFAPTGQSQGYAELFRQLELWLEDITGFAKVSLQPNSGAQGEYAGLMSIHAYHEARGDSERTICLIPSSAHGTNPASAVMAGMSVVVVRCDEKGNIDLEDLTAKATQYREKLAALMVTYPSTHGVFEESIKTICRIVHENGGQVYMDGANMNAQVGLCRPAELGADVCHLNLHKTFCIPHGGGGPGVGPIGVAAHLVPFLPSHPVVPVGSAKSIGPVSAAPWGSASILPISWSYIAMMGSEGLTQATRIAILSANYMATRLEDHYPILYRGINHRVAHEFIVDLRGFRGTAGIEAEDVAKRLIDYGFHAPTVSFPVAGTLMIEPTESESKDELDRFCDAMIAIRQEIAEIENGNAEREDNVLKNAPHTMAMIASDEWTHPYSRSKGAFPASWTREHKFWPAVARVNNAFGDRNLICACPPVESYTTPVTAE